MKPTLVRLRSAARPLLPIALACAALPALSGCTVIAVGSAVVGAGVSVASTAVDATMLVGKGVIKVGSVVVGD